MLRSLAASALAALALASRSPGAAAQELDTEPATCGSEGMSLVVDRGVPSATDVRTSAVVVAARDKFIASLESYASESILDTRGSGFDADTHVTDLGAFGTATYTNFDDQSRGFRVDGTGTVSFSSPQQAVSMYLRGVDNFNGGQMTVQCAHGGTETYTYEGPREDEFNPGVFTTVRSSTDPGDWCTSITIVPAGSGDSVWVQDVVAGSCASESNVAEYGCASVSASSPDTASVTLSFSESGPFTAACDDR